MESSSTHPSLMESDVNMFVTIGTTGERRKEGGEEEEEVEV